MSGNASGLNWFTVDMTYHHVHHLSARIPSYCLVDGHNEYEHLFSEVKRITLCGILHALVRDGIASSLRSSQ